MYTFWAIAIALTGFVVVVLARTSLRASNDLDVAEEKDIEVYRAQLKELDRDVERGTVSKTDAEALRTEIARRLLAADTALQKATKDSSGAPLIGSIFAGLAVGAVGIGLYMWIGAPGYGDMPLNSRLAKLEERAANRPAQAVAQNAYLATLEAPAVDEGHAALVDELRAAVTERPDDLRGLALLARNEALLGNYAAAIDAQSRILLLKPETTAADHRDMAELMIVSAGGYVSPEAEDQLILALSRNPQDALARYYLGLMHDQAGRHDRAFAMWQPLLEESAPNAPWVSLIREQIPFVAQQAGIRYVLPDERGPSNADLAAAQELSPEERAEMIAGMVQSLADRLATQGGPPEDWARLITAQAVLGNRDTATAILAEARTVFADRADAMNLFQRTALQAGLE